VTSEEDFDLEARELCSDGNCTGILDDAGRCKECGRSALSGTGATEAVSSAEETDDFETRQLCPDGNCTGVLGQDGRCKECGRSP
jgi:hypothetical protein